MGNLTHWPQVQTADCSCWLDTWQPAGHFQLEYLSRISKLIGALSNKEALIFMIPHHLYITYSFCSNAQDYSTCMEG